MNQLSLVGFVERELCAQATLGIIFFLSFTAKSATFGNSLCQFPMLEAQNVQLKIDLQRLGAEICDPASYHMTRIPAPKTEVDPFCISGRKEKRSSSR